MSTAWHLAQLGHEVQIIDCDLNNSSSAQEKQQASKASLGVLMGYLFKRSTGRSWILRKNSLELWPKWIQMLKSQNKKIKIETPLIKIATSEKEAFLMKQLAEERKHLGIEYIPKESSSYFNGDWPKIKYGGIISNNEGRINPSTYLKCLTKAIIETNIEQIRQKVINIERGSQLNRKKRWIIHMENGSKIYKETIVLCTSLGTEILLRPLNHFKPMTPILGQALEIEVNRPKTYFSKWPAVLSFEGINLITTSKNSLILGATLENTLKPNKDALEEMLQINKNAPYWLKSGSIIRKWYGIRARPSKQPAPILEKLEPGLIIATGHYRNGILLAPGTANWVGKEIKR